MARSRAAVVKRAFERREGQLVDRYQEPGARASASRSFDAAIFVRGRRPKAERATPARAKAWVDALRAGEWDALSRVVDQRGAPGVRAALRALDERELVTTALGRVGGPGARDALARAVSRLARARATFRADGFCNRDAQRLATLAKALLWLDPEATSAASALVRLFEHPVAYNRMFAVWNATEAYVGLRVDTEARDLLGEGLRPLVKTRDEEVFVKAIPALRWLAYEAMQKRCARLLRTGSPWIRSEVVNNLLKCPAPFELMPMVLEWLGYETSLRIRLEYARLLGRAVPGEQLEALAQAGLASESPSERYDAIELLAVIEAERARRLAVRALRDEPERVLRAMLQRVARRGARGAGG